MILRSLLIVATPYEYLIQTALNSMQRAIHIWCVHTHSLSPSLWHTHTHTHTAYLHCCSRRRASDPYSCLCTRTRTHTLSLYLSPSRTQTIYVHYCSRCFECQTPICVCENTHTHTHTHMLTHTHTHKHAHSLSTIALLQPLPLVSETYSCLCKHTRTHTHTHTHTHTRTHTLSLSLNTLALLPLQPRASDPYSCLCPLRRRALFWFGVSVTGVWVTGVWVTGCACEGRPHESTHIPPVPPLLPPPHTRSWKMPWVPVACSALYLFTGITFAKCDIERNTIGLMVLPYGIADAAMHDGHEPQKHPRYAASESCSIRVMTFRHRAWSFVWFVPLAPNSTDKWISTKRHLMS